MACKCETTSIPDDEVSDKSMNLLSYRLDMDRARNTHPGRNDFWLKKFVAEQYRTQYKENRAAEQIEDANLGVSGEYAVASAEMTIEDGEVRYKTTGRNILEAPERYHAVMDSSESLAQLETMRAIREALLSGANQVTGGFVESRGQEQLFRIAKVDNENRFTYSIVNTISKDSPYTFAQQKEIAVRLFGDHALVEKSALSYVLIKRSEESDHSKPSKDIPRDIQQSSVDRVIKHTIDQGMMVTNSIRNEISYTAKSIKKYWEKRMNDKMQRETQTRSESGMRHRDAELNTKNTERRKIATQFLRNLDRVEHALSFIHTTAVGTAAFPLLIEQLAHDPNVTRKKRIKESNHVLEKKRIRRNLHARTQSEARFIKETKIEKRRNKRALPSVNLEKKSTNKQKKKNQETVFSAIGEKQTPMLSAIKEKRVYKEAKIKRKRHKRSVHEISMGVVPKDIHVSRREKKHFKNQRRLMRLVRLQIARITNYEAKLVQRTKKAYVERVAQKREKLLIRKKKTIALHKVSLFIAYYLLLHRSPNIHKTLQTPVLHTREIVLQQSKKISQPVDGVIKPNEANPESPWIILSIIYYLTMIREQGMTQYPVQPSAMIIGANKRPPQLAKHAYTSNMIKSLNLPKNGVIYRYFGTNDIV